MSTEVLQSSQKSAPIPPKQNSSGGTVDSFEKLGKLSTLSAILVTICGYVVVSLHDAHFGYVSPSPLRPKVISAGILFLLFVGGPISVGSIQAKTILPISTLKKLVIDILRSLFVLVIIGSLLLIILELFLTKPSGTNGVRALIWAAGASLSIWLLMTAVTHIKLQVPDWLVGLIGIAVSTVFVVHQIRYFRAIPENLPVAIWSTFLCIGALLPHLFFSNINLRGRVIAVIAVPFLCAAIFSSWIFDLIDPGWGGGKPSRIELVFTKDSLAPNLHAHKLLLDETDIGFYISDSTTGLTQFVPRTEVALITYLDN